MQLRFPFRTLRRTIESELIAPTPRDAVQRLAVFVPKATGPSTELFGSVLFVEDAIWRFKTEAGARRFAVQMETYFRNFDSTYRIKSLGSEADVAQAQAH